MDASSASALVDGVAMSLAEAALAVTDEGVSRGDGAFETIGVWDGAPFCLDGHLARLDESLAKTLLPPADRPALQADIDTVLATCTVDAALRCYVTGSMTRVVTLSPQPVRGPMRHLEPHYAPWIVPPERYPAAGAKTMSYGPNMTATRAARQAGGDDAVLMGEDGELLEGPTFALLWVIDGALYAVPPERGIVDSVSRRALLDLARRDGIAVYDGRLRLEDLERVDEVLACSAVRAPTALQTIGSHALPATAPLTDRLADALDDARRGRRDVTV